MFEWERDMIFSLPPGAVVRSVYPLQNSASYQATILTPNLNFIRRVGQRGGPAYVYMQDGAPCHTFRSTMAFLAAHRVRRTMAPELA